MPKSGVQPAVARGRRFEVVPMRLSDLDDVMEIERHAFKSPWSRQIFVEELEREWARLDVVKDRQSGRALAFVNYWLVRDEVHILNIATRLEERRRGHSSRLLQHVIDFARKNACREITLEVRRSNQPAIQLYRKYAFRPVGIRPNYYADNNEDAIVMLLDL